MNSHFTLWELAKNIFRITYTATFVLASLTGVALALTIRNEPFIAFLIVLDVFILALFVNFSNDYFDHMSGADSTRFFSEDKEFERGAREILSSKIYWSGNALDQGFISEKGGRMLMGALAAAAVVVAIPIVIYGGWIVVAMGLVAFFLSYFYTAPPLNLGARGLGELDVFASFFSMSLFSFFVIVQEWAWEAFLVALVVGLLVMMMRIVDEMSGYEAHMKAGEKDICVRFGLENAVRIVIALILAVYAISVLLALNHISYALLLLSLPLALGLVKIFRNKTDRFRFVRPAPQMFKLAFSHQLLIILALTARTFLTSA